METLVTLVNVPVSRPFYSRFIRAPLVTLAASSSMTSESRSAASLKNREVARPILAG